MRVGFHGGTGAWVDSLAARLRARGGRVHLKHRVDRVLVEKGRAVGIETDRGKRYYADRLLWTIPLAVLLTITLVYIAPSLSIFIGHSVE